jgi:hypothetical protein
MNDRSDELVKEILEAIPTRPVPDLAPAVMARVAGIPLPTRTSRVAHLADWLWAPRPMSMQWRPAYGFAVIALLAMAPLMKRGAETPLQTAAAQQVLVQFRLDAPSAQQVQLAGNFTNWKAAIPMRRTAGGVWTVVLPLEPGVHNYAFVVDGKQWVADPMAPAVSDGFGGLNSQLAVLTPDQGRSL